MSLLPPRKPRPLGRQRRRQRDDRLFIIATEDTYAPKQYFAAFNLARVTIEVVETNNAQSAAAHVVARLKSVVEDSRQRGDVRDDDQFWVVLDTDHWTAPNHVAAFSKAIKEARDAGFHIAVSNPCFELWLLLHVADVSLPVGDADSVEAQLRAALGGYNKKNVPAARLVPHVDVAVARAKLLDVGAGGWPQTVGTQVHLLVAELLR